VALGSAHACATDASSGIECWGENGNGQVQPRIEGAPPATATAGSTYSFRFSTTHQDPGPSFSVSSGALPPGLALSSAGLLSGKPTVPGTYAFSVTATNGITEDAQATASIAVAAPPVAAQQLPPPVDGQSFNIERQDGSVKIKGPGEEAFGSLVDPRHVPVGCVVDTRQGTAALHVSRGSNDRIQSASFWGGVFSAVQSSGIEKPAVLTLVGRLRCQARSDSKARPRRVLARRRGKGRSLWGSGSGNFKTAGNHGSATVRGTTWLVRDRCDGTTQFKVREGTVWARDFVKGITKVLNAGETYVTAPKFGKLP
jgi:hypothetical protein